MINKSKVQKVVAQKSYPLRVPDPDADVNDDESDTDDGEPIENDPLSA